MKKSFGPGREYKIYILPTGHGLLFIAGVFVMILTGATYGNNLIYLLAFSLFSVVMVGMVQTHANLRKVKLNSAPPEDGFVGEWTRAEIRLHHKNKVARQSLSVRLKKDPRMQSKSALIDSLPAEGSARVFVPVKGLKRGVFTLPSWVIETRAPLGLFRSWMYVNAGAEIYFYPALHGEKKLPRGGGRGEDREPPARTARISEEMDFREHRAYVRGESHRHIDWKIVARRGDYLTKVFEGESGEPHRFDYSSLEGLDRETRLSQLSLWIHEAQLKHLAFEMRLPEKRIPAGRGSPHAKAALRELARFEGAGRDS
jgi:uncharacterized protein (DUF58 family)